MQREVTIVRRETFKEPEFSKKDAGSLSRKAEPEAIYRVLPGDLGNEDKKWKKVK